MSNFARFGFFFANAKLASLQKEKGFLVLLVLVARDERINCGQQEEEEEALLPNNCSFILGHESEGSRDLVGDSRSFFFKFLVFVRMI